MGLYESVSNNYTEEGLFNCNRLSNEEKIDRGKKILPVDLHDRVRTSPKAIDRLIVY
jgi:hypothetical protein